MAHKGKYLVACRTGDPLDTIFRGTGGNCSVIGDGGSLHSTFPCGTMRVEDDGVPALHGN